MECKWGDSGLNEIITDADILGVAVVLAGQAQVFCINLFSKIYLNCVCVHIHSGFLYYFFS